MAASYKRVCADHNPEILMRIINLKAVGGQPSNEAAPNGWCSWWAMRI